MGPLGRRGAEFAVGLIGLGVLTTGAINFNHNTDVIAQRMGRDLSTADQISDFVQHEPEMLQTWGRNIMAREIVMTPVQDARRDAESSLSQLVLGAVMVGGATVSSKRRAE